MASPAAKEIGHAASDCSSVAGSDGPSGSSGAPKRRISAGKAQAAIDVLTEKTLEADHELQLQELIKMVRKDVGLLASCRAVAKKRAKELQTCLPKGVRTLKDVSDKLAKKTLAKLAKVHEGVFANMETEENQSLMLWAVKKTLSYRVPRVEMPEASFFDWMVEMHAFAGSRLEGVKWEQVNCDLDWSLGWCGFKVAGDPAEMDPETEVCEVKEHGANRVGTLPVGFRPKIKEVGSTWRLVHNYSEETALLKNVKNDSTFKLKYAFEAPVHSSVYQCVLVELMSKHPMYQCVFVHSSVYQCTSVELFVPLSWQLRLPARMRRRSSREAARGHCHAHWPQGQGRQRRFWTRRRRLRLLSLSRWIPRRSLRPRRAWRQRSPRAPRRPLRPRRAWRHRSPRRPPIRPRQRGIGRLTSPM